jgi:hypothetical protein
MTTYGIADSLHRLVKLAIDSGAAATIAEAEAMFREYRVQFRLHADDAASPSHQAALLTGVMLAKRVFLGGVEVVGELDFPLKLPVFPDTTLLEAVTRLGASAGADSGELPTISIGGPVAERVNGFHVRTVFGGWRGGIVPGHSAASIQEDGVMPLAPMLSASLAVNEAYLHLSHRAPAAGRRSVGMSLWDPAERDWFDAGGEPELRFLPSHLWLIGLGHLGQAYLWALGLLPYGRPGGLSLILQDFDKFTPSSTSTCILSDFAQVGEMKTRALASWAKQRGFQAAIYERPFDASFRRRDDEPAVALCGIDNGHGRRALDQVGFDMIVEAGLGRGHGDFRRIRMHTLPGLKAASELWQVSATPSEEVRSRTAYQDLLKAGALDQCGVTTLAGKAVGAPFVGAVAACLVVSEVLRILNGGQCYDVIELDLGALDYRSAIVGAHRTPPALGFVTV